MIVHDTPICRYSTVWLPAEEEESDFVTTKEACDLLGISRKTLYRNLENGTIEGAHRVGSGDWRIPRSSIGAVLHSGTS